MSMVETFYEEMVTEDTSCVRILLDMYHAAIHNTRVFCTLVCKMLF